jgi:hypothetical protein
MNRAGDSLRELCLPRGVLASEHRVGPLLLRLHGGPGRHAHRPRTLPAPVHVDIGGRDPATHLKRHLHGSEAGEDEGCGLPSAALWSGAARRLGLPHASPCPPHPSVGARIVFVYSCCAECRARMLYCELCSRAPSTRVLATKHLNPLPGSHGTHSIGLPVWN